MSNNTEFISLDKLNGLKLRELIQPWLTPIISLASLLLIGTFGYRITEGWDWGDSLWMVLITISTIGFAKKLAQFFVKSFI